MNATHFLNLLLETAPRQQTFPSVCKGTARVASQPNETDLESLAFILTQHGPEKYAENKINHDAARQL